MAKSRIIKELVNDDIGVGKALYRLMLIADDIGDKSLFDWAEKEISGYNEEDEVPEYRKISTGIIRYSGINGRMQITNTPLPDYYLPEEIRGSIRVTNIFDGIEGIERFSNSDDKLIKDLTSLAPHVYSLSGGIQCTSISFFVDSSAVSNILSVIKTKAIKVLLKLEKEFGNLDDLDITDEQISGTDLQKLYKELKLIVYDNSVQIGDGNTIKESSFRTGVDK